MNADAKNYNAQTIASVEFLFSPEGRKIVRNALLILLVALDDSPDPDDILRALQVRELLTNIFDIWDEGV